MKNHTITFLVLITICTIKVSAQKIKSSARTIISGYSKDYNQMDIIINNDILNINETSIAELLNPKTENIISVKSKNSIFKVKIANIEHITHIGLQLVDSTDTSHRREHTQQFIIESGDSVSFLNKNGEFYFKGRNAEKYNCEYKLNKIYTSKISLEFVKRQTDLKKWFLQCDSITLECLKLLEGYKTRITNQVYWDIKSEIIGKFTNRKLLNLTIYGGSFHSGIYTPYLKSIGDYSNRNLNDRVRDYSKENDWFKNSNGYLDFLSDEFKIDSCFLKGRAYSSIGYFDFLSKNTKGPLREWAIYHMLEKTTKENLAYCLNNTFNHEYIKNPTLKLALMKMKNNLPGGLAYNFSLPDTLGKIIRQTDLTGKIILIDTWYFGCGPCRQLHPILDSIKNVLGRNDFQVVSVCICNGSQDWKNEWLKEIRSGKYTSANNINLYDNSKNSPFVKHYGITFSPTLILINKQGILTEQPTDPLYDNGKSLIRIVKENL